MEKSYVSVLFVLQLRKRKFQIQEEKRIENVTRAPATAEKLFSA